MAKRVSGAKDQVDGAAAFGGLSSLIPSWERSLRARNRAAKTIRSYGDTARLFEGFLLREGLPTVVADVGREHVESFIEAQLREFRPATAAVRYRSLQQFFKWALEEEEISESPMARMSPPHVPEEPVPVVSDDEIKRAVEVAQAGFVWDLPWGLETRVGEQGYTLSGGQRQRLALARAVLGGPPVLVLDDPLSSVDVHTEAVIEEALARVLKGVTGLLVVHRPSTLALADKVALIDGGRVAAVGTHTELMRSNEVYRALLSQEYELQAEEVLA